MVVWPRMAGALTLAIVLAGATAARAAEPLKSAAEIRAMTDEERNDAAAVAARELLQHVEQQHGTRAAETAEALERLARALARANRYDARGKEERLAVAERALAIRYELDDQSSMALAWSHYVVGLVRNFGLDPEPGIEHFGKALRIAEGHLGKGHPETEVYLRELGAALYDAGRYRDAIDVSELHREVAVAKHGGGHSKTLSAYYNLALSHHDLGELDIADRQLLNAENILALQESANAQDLVWVRSLRGTILTRQGRLAEAQRHYQRTLELAQETLGHESPEAIELENALSRALIDIGDYDRASDLLSSALQRYDDKPLDATACSVLYNLGSARYAIGDVAGAKALFERLITNGPEAVDLDHPVWGDFHNAYAAVLAETGDLAGARRHVDRAVALGREMGEETFEFAETLTHSGALSIAEGRPDVALEQLDRALRVIKRIAGGNPRYHDARSDLAEAFFASGRRAEAFDAAVAGAREATEFDRATIAMLARRQAVARAVRPRRARDLALGMVVASPDAAPSWKKAAYELLLRSRSIVFDEMARRQRRWSDTDDPGTRERFEELTEARSRVSNLFMIGPRGGDPFHSSLLEAEQARVERLENELAATGHPVLLPGDVPDFDSVKASLDAGTALVSFTRYGKRTGQGRKRTPHYAAAVLRRDDAAPAWLDLGPASNLERAIAEWLATMAPANVDALGEAGYRDAARELYRLLWAPLGDRLSDVDTVYVVPDAAIHLVSFAALPAGDEYLLESGPAFHYLTAERDVVPLDLDGEIQVAGLLLVGDPAFNASGKGEADPQAYRSAGPDCSSFRGHKFTRLPGSRQEARAVKRLWTEAFDEDVVELTGTAATEHRVKSRASGRRVLHLATHGFFLGEECVETGGGYRGIASMSPARRRDDAVVSRVGNPLLLSGLALAGANHRTARGAAGKEDGVLTAEEVGTLDLRGTELAVLSACRTGTGSVTEGAGMFGLRRAFLLAGVRTVVTSLWDVEDRSAGVWIEKLYRERLLAGKSIPEAMRLAALHVLETRRAAGLDTHPFFWAGWVAVGRN